MASLLDLASSYPARILEPGEALIQQGGSGGDLYILESGELSVERDGVAITKIVTRNALVGEMAVLTGTAASATVRASGRATIRTIQNAREQLLRDPELTFQLASLVASRLSATTALLVELSREHQGKPEQNLLARLIAAIHLSAADDFVVTRNDMFG